MYILASIEAQSQASVPPEPAWMSMYAEFTSVGRDNHKDIKYSLARFSRALTSETISSSIDKSELVPIRAKWCLHVRLDENIQDTH